MYSGSTLENELNGLRDKHLLFIHKRFLENPIQLPVRQCAIVGKSSCTHSLTSERCCGKKDVSILRFPLCPQSEHFGA